MASADDLEPTCSAEQTDWQQIAHDLRALVRRSLAACARPTPLECLQLSDAARTAYWFELAAAKYDENRDNEEDDE